MGSVVKRARLHTQLGLGLGLVAAAAASLGALEPAAAQPAPGDSPPAPAPAPTPTGVVTKPPALLQAVAPDYPPAALSAGKQATVKVRIHLDADGLATKVEVMTPVGDGFDEAAVAAAMQYLFSPAEIDGVPASIVIETAINFVIEQVEAAPEVKPPAPTGGEADVPAGPAHRAGNLKAPVTLSGVAVERGTRRKLAGVIVSVAELGLDAITAEDGSFFFHGVPAGRYQLLAVDDRFDRFERPVVLTKGEELEVRLWMRPRGGNPYETVVEGEREVLEVTRRSLQRQQLVSVPGTFGDPIRVIQTLPGLARPPFGLGVLIVRGSNPDDTGVFVDGHQVPLLFHFLGGPSIFNAEAVDSLDLYPGGFPARFGRFHGGVVAIETRAATADGVHGQADVDLLDAGGYVRAPLRKDLAIAVGGRRSYIDQLLPYVLPEPSPGSQRVVVPIYYDYQARIDWDGKQHGKLALYVLGSSDTLDVLQADAEEESSLALNSSVGFWRVIASYKRPMPRGLTLTLSPAFGRGKVAFAGSQADAAGPFTSLALNQSVLAYRMRLHGRVSPRVVLDTGIDLESRVATYDILAPNTDDIAGGGDVDADPEVSQLGAESLGAGLYADVGVDVTSRLRLIPGLRLDGYVIQGQPKWSVDPRLVGRYATSKTTTVKAYAGVFHQPPQPEALDISIGNPDVDIERGVHWGVGGEWKPTRLWSLDGELYIVDRQNVVVFTNDVVMRADGTIRPLNFVNTGRRYSYGAEMLIKREISERVFGWASYTFSVSRQRADDDEAYVPTGFDQMHNLNLVTSWKPGGGWELGGRLRLTTGRPATPIVGSTLDADSGGYDSLAGPRRSTRTPVYHQVDVRAERMWLFDTWSMGLYLDIQNAYNAKNVEATEYDYRFRESAPVTGIPFLPTIGIRGQW